MGIRFAQAVGALVVVSSVETAAFAQSRDAASSPPPPAMPVASEVVIVHIDSPDEVELEMQQGEKWIKVCDSPCDKPLKAKEFYRINGSGVRASKPFQIQPGQ